MAFELLALNGLIEPGPGLELSGLVKLALRPAGHRLVEGTLGLGLAGWLFEGTVLVRHALPVSAFLLAGADIRDHRVFALLKAASA